MKLTDIVDTADARDFVTENSILQVKVGAFDHDTILRGQYLSPESFYTCLQSGLRLSEQYNAPDTSAVSNKLLLANSFSDSLVNVVLNTGRPLPQERDAVLFLAEFPEHQYGICPRQSLKRVLRIAEDMRMIAQANLRYDFYLFDETAHSLQEKGYQSPTPLTPSQYGHSLLRSAINHDFFEALLDMCRTMQMPLAELQTKEGPGLVSAMLPISTALRAADNAALLKTFSKILAQRFGWLASFMAKWSMQHPGCDSRLRLKLTNDEKDPLFFDPANNHKMSQIMQYFVAGQLALMPELAIIFLPTINAYTRLAHGFSCPKQACWGIENKTCAIRVLSYNDENIQTECRLGGADTNPYLCIMAALASGLYGIQQKLPLEKPVIGSAYQISLDARHQLPDNLLDAVRKFKNSSFAREWFGDDFVEFYAASREKEAIEANRYITDWQLKRYFEMI